MERARLRDEVVGGITTFFTMSYIVVVNPAILSTSGTGMPFGGVLTATALLSFLGTLLMGLYAKLPFAVAPGMGINAFFTYKVILEQQVPWPVALGMVFWAGVIFLLASVTPVRVMIARAIPPNLRMASAVGIGPFLTFIGLQKAGVIVGSPATLVTTGKLDRTALFAGFGLLLMIALMRKKSPFAFLAGMATITLLGWLSDKVEAPRSLLSMPDFESVTFKLDIWGALKLALFPSIIGIFFTDLFDSISTFIGVSHSAGLVDEKGEPRNLKEGLVVDSFATLGAGLLGTSSGTAYIESAAGIEAGGRTGVSAVVTALCFLPCLFLGPVAGMVPGYATAPVLILVGALMFRSVGALDMRRLEDLVPAFLAIILIPLTFSITQGILWGFIAHCLLYAMAGRRREVPPMMWAIGAVSVLLIWIELGS